MATVTPRTWTNPKTGKTSKRFVLGYADRAGKWHRRQFKTSAAANAERVRIEGELSNGSHVADRASITVAAAVDSWLADYQALVDAGKRERSTITGYTKLTETLKASDIAELRIARLSGPDILAFSRWLESRETVDKSLRCMKALRLVLDHAIGRGWCAVNLAKSVKIRTAGDRHDEHVEIPPKRELQALVEAAREMGAREAAIVHVLLFVGLRASEMLGLRDTDIDRSELRVKQRVDQFGKVGVPKSKNGRRAIPMPPGAWLALAAWKLQAPASKRGLLFSNGNGNPERYANIWNRLWVPLMQRACLVDKEQRPRFGLHALRHACISLWIEQNVSPKKVSAWAGHSSVAFTLDTYGHLWKQHETDAQIAAATEAALYK